MPETGHNDDAPDGPELHRRARMAIDQLAHHLGLSSGDEVVIDALLALDLIVRRGGGRFPDEEGVPPKRVRG